MSQILTLWYRQQAGADHLCWVRPALVLKVAVVETTAMGHLGAEADALADRVVRITGSKIVVVKTPTARTTATTCPAVLRSLTP
jgi:hypothetical protein